MVLLTLHSLWGLCGGSHPPTAVLNLPGQALLPHLASPRVRSPASRHRSGIRACEPLPGPQRMWSGKWEHVECVCFDLSRLHSLQRMVSGTVSVCLTVIDSPFFRCFLSFSKIKKTYTAYFSPELDCIYYDML